MNARTHGSEPDYERYQRLIDAITDYAIFMLDAGGRIASWNEGARRIHGYQDQEILGEHFSKFYTDAERAAELPERALGTARGQGRFEREGWRVRKDGSCFWAHVIIDPIFDELGRLTGYAKITRDLTERKRAAERLRESEEQFRLLVQSVSDYAIFMLSPEGNVSTWNPGAQRIKGYSREEILGRHFSTFYTDEDRRSGLPARALHTAEHEGRFEHEGWRVRKDGTRFWANVVVDPIRDDTGKLVGFAKVTRDITKARATRDALEAFAYSVSHDLRAPLRGMEGFARILLDDFAEQLGQKGKSYAERIVTAASRMERLISDMLSFSRLQRVELRVREVNADAILRHHAREITASAGLDQDSVRILNVIPSIMADSTVLGQIFANLLSNAVKFRNPGSAPSIRIWSESHQDRVCIFVQDEGIGISQEHQDRIFQVFERLHDQESYPGTGIGLAIAKLGVERMGGAIRLVSKVGEGSTFSIDLASPPNHKGEEG
jgi:PAS domain S-box-containing protein